MLRTLLVVVLGWGLLGGTALAQTVTYKGGSIYDLDPPAQQSTRVLEAVRGADDMQPVSDLAENDVLRRLARPVGRFTYATATGELGHCTASIIARDLILTNHHCVHDAQEALLWMGYLYPRSRRGVAQYPVVFPPVESHRALDYAILRVKGAPGAEWGTVTLGQREPGPRQSLFIIHHPGGFAQRISLGRCRAHDPSVDGDDILHVCDTMGGSSGAPIFDNGTREVVGLHYSAVDIEGLNAGKRIALLAKRSRKLAALMPGEGEPKQTTSDDTGGSWFDWLSSKDRSPADAPIAAAAQEWAAIQDTKSCAVLEAFLAEHGKTSFARYAAARQKELECGVWEIIEPGETDVAVGVYPDQGADTTPACDGVNVSLGSGGSKCIKPGSGESFRDCENCPEMVVVPAGSFIMGSSQEEIATVLSDPPSMNKQMLYGEHPQRQVEIPGPFAVGKFEVTFDEWDDCVSAGGCYYRPDDEGWGRGRRPVINASWIDIKQQYLPWLSKKTGKKYRMLTESEWEYMARAGSQTRFSFGDNADDLCGHANGADRSTSFGWRNRACDDGVGERTAEVGRYQANAWGLHDVHGNVWEWVEDCYMRYKNVRGDKSARTTEECKTRVLRGGSWYSFHHILRSAVRGFERPNLRDYFRNDQNGFRLARTLDP